MTPPAGFEPITQLEHARLGVITPEMARVATREPHLTAARVRDEVAAGRMVIPTALAMAGDHVIGTLGLHRIEVNIRPENAASLAVVRKLGFREEGLRPNFLHIAGGWRDHLSFALTTEDLAGELGRLRELRRASMGPLEVVVSLRDGEAGGATEVYLVLIE